MFMGVLDWPTVSGKPAEGRLRDRLRNAVEKSRMVEQTFDDRDKRAERKAIAWRKRGVATRSSVRVRWSPAPNAMAMNRVGSWTDTHPASRTSIGSPLGQCVPRRLAGKVAASFAMTRSPGLKRQANARAQQMSYLAVAIDDEEFGCSAIEPLTAIIDVPRRDGCWARQCVEHRLDDFRSGILGRFNVARIGIGNSERVQRRIHVAGIDR